MKNGGLTQAKIEVYYQEKELAVPETGETLMLLNRKNKLIEAIVLSTTVTGCYLKYVHNGLKDNVPHKVLRDWLVEGIR